MKQPDRFARVVKQAYLKNHVDDGMDGTVWTRETAALLRKEHRAVVQMVRDIRKYRQGSYIMLSGDKHNQWISKSEIFESLEKRLT